MSNKQKQVQYLVNQPQTLEVAVAPPRYQPPPQPPGTAGILKPFLPSKDGKPPYLKGPSDPANKQQPYPQQPQYPPAVPNLKLYPLSTQQQFPYVGAAPTALQKRQRHSEENLNKLITQDSRPLQGNPQRPRPTEEELRVVPQTQVKPRISDEDFLRLPPVEMLKFVKKTEVEASRYSAEQNKHIQTLVNELRTVKEANQRLSDDNQELRDLCCFLDDDRQKGRKLAREWQRFGRYTASVMRQEVSAYQNKLRELDNKQQELIKDNLELKELCLYLDEERSGGGMCTSCGANNGGSLRDEGDGSSSSTNADEPQVPPQFSETPGNAPRRSASRERILHENLSRQRSTFNEQTMQYVRNLEIKIQQLEEDKKLLHNKLIQGAAAAANDPNHLSEFSPMLSGRPEAVVRALQVLEVREQLERDGHVPDRPDNIVDDNSSADMDDCEKALVREMCNVVWHKMEEGPSNGRR